MVIKISEAFAHWVRNTFPKLEEELKLAQMRGTPQKFIKRIFALSLIIAMNFTLVVYILLANSPFTLFVVPAFFFFTLFFMVLLLQVPKINIEQIRHEIESDIFVPARMLLTLLESGNSIVTSLERVSYTNAKSSKYFGKIATEIYLGKQLSEAIDEAIKYTPSDSFKRVMQPIRKSLMAGTDVRKSLTEVLEDMVQEKMIEIEKYEKKLSAVSLFYMIFGVIIPAISVVMIVVVMSVMGLTVNFFPFLFIMIILILLIQFGFIKLFQSIRPLMRL